MTPGPDDTAHDYSYLTAAHTATGPTDLPSFPRMFVSTDTEPTTDLTDDGSRLYQQYGVTESQAKSEYDQLSERAQAAASEAAEREIKESEAAKLFEVMQGLDIQNGSEIEIVLRNGTKIELRIEGLNGHMLMGTSREVWISPEKPLDMWDRNTQLGTPYSVERNVVVDRREIVAVFQAKGYPQMGDVQTQPFQEGSARDMPTLR